MMKKSLSFIFLFSLFTLVFAGCSKPKSPSGDGGDNPPVVATDLEKDLNGKTDIFPLLDDVKVMFVENIFLETYFYGNDSSRYFKGITPSNETTTMNFNGAGFNTEYGGSYLNKKYCVVVYNKDSHKRISEPQCNLVLETTLSRVFTLTTFTEERLMYAFIGDSVENSSEYFVLPPVHKKA